MADTKRSREEQGKNKEASRRRRDIERAKETSDEDVEYEDLLEPEEAEKSAAEATETAEEADADEGTAGE